MCSRYQERFKLIRFVSRVAQRNWDRNTESPPRDSPAAQRYGSTPVQRYGATTVRRYGGTGEACSAAV